MELDLVEETVSNMESVLSTRPPLSMPSNFFANISEKTQSSVFLQKEIQIETSMLTTGKKVDGDLITNLVHDQASTYLCSSISTISALRSACMSYLASKVELSRVRIF